MRRLRLRASRIRLRAPRVAFPRDRGRAHARGCAAQHLAAAPVPPPLKIGIIGSGHIGGTLATLWVKAGHEVLISSRHPEELKSLAASLGARAHVGTPREAALFGEVVLVSVPYKALPEIGRDLKSELAGKIVLDTCNPYPERDGPMAVEVRAEGHGSQPRRSSCRACAWCALSTPSVTVTWRARRTVPATRWRYRWPGDDPRGARRCRATGARCGLRPRGRRESKPGAGV